MKKHAALLLAVALAGSMFLASCSGDGSGASAPESSGGTESQSASAEESSGAETPELSGELVVMTLAGEPFVPAWQDQAAVFTEQTGVQVTIDSVPWENLRETCTLELASATGAYDVIYVHPSWFQEFAKNGYLVPADEYTTEEDLEKYITNLVDDYRYEGTLYGLPDWITTHVLAYRTDIFEQESLDPPETWDDLLAVCEQLSGSSEYSPISFPGKKGGALASIFSSLLTSNGGWYFNDAGEPNVNSAEGVEVAEFLADLAPYLPSGYQNFHWDENGQTASGGKAAMTLVATQSTTWLEEESSATAGKWVYLALKSNKGTVGGIIDDYCWSVCVDSQNKEAAGEFVKFFTDTDAQKYFTQKSSTCGATKAYYEDTELQESIPMLSAMSEILNENTNPAPSWGTWAAECEILEVNLQNVMNGNMTAQDALNQVQAKMTEG